MVKVKKRMRKRKRNIKKRKRKAIQNTDIFTELFTANCSSNFIKEVFTEESQVLLCLDFMELF